MTSSVSKSCTTTAARLRAVAALTLLFTFDSVAGGQSTSSIDSAGDGDCPSTCFCNPLSRIVYCSRRGLDAVPRTLPRHTLQLNVNGNHFRSPVLRRANFSASEGASSIEHLYLSDCAIEGLEVNAFSDLTQLRWLDLSDNRLRVIPRRAFDGLTLQHLFLNGNRHIRLQDGSFHGLATSGLYLHDCALEAVLPETLLPLNGTLVNLWLNGNRLTGVDQRLSSVFAQLSHLRLGANPLHCGCDALWLKRLYDRHGGATFRGAEPPTCWTPARLRAKHFDQLTTSDLHCSAPSFGNIDAMLHWQGTGRLRCTATGQPTPTIYWIRPSGRTRRFDATRTTTTQDDVQRRAYAADAGRNEGVLSINYVEAESGVYICVAKNEVGNVTLTINVSVTSHGGLQPRRSTTSSSLSLLSAAAATDTGRLSNSLAAPPQLPQSPTLSVINLVAADDDDSGSRYINTERRKPPDLHQTDVAPRDERLFTLLELVAAVVATHLGTVLLVFVVLLAVHCVRTERRRRRAAVRAYTTPDSAAVDPLRPVARSCDLILNGKSSAMKSTCTVRSYHWPDRLDYDAT